MKPITVAAVAASLALGPAALSAPAAPRFCATGETPLFGCMAGAKAIAVCARGTAVQYRFGAPGKPELVYPAAGATGGLYRASAAFSGGGEAQIGFVRGDHRYVVYSRVVRRGFGRSGNDTGFEAGVFIRRGDALLTDKRCTAPADADVDLGRAESLLPEGEFLYADE